jgi:hypothetical protein
MRSNEFVKKFGWDRARAFVEFDSDIEIIYTASFFEELKHLVESYELIEKYGGLEKVKNIVDGKDPFELTAMEGYFVKAIADVESCQ